MAAYLSSNTSNTAKRLRAEMGTQARSLVLGLDDNEVVTDEFVGVKFLWTFTKLESTKRSEYSTKHERVCDLSFHKKHREMVTKKYLNHVVKEGMEIRMRNRQRTVLAIS